MSPQNVVNIMSNPDQPKSNTLPTILGIANICTLAPWLMMVYVSFFAFDAPGSDQNRWIWAMVISIWTYPIPLVLTLIAAYICVRKNMRSLAFSFLSFPWLFAVIWFSIFLAPDLI